MSILNDFMEKRHYVYSKPMSDFISYLSAYKVLCYPLWLEISLTDACNQRCQHCSKLQHDNKGGVHFLPSHMIDEIMSCNPFQIILTGGEPSLHPQFFSIVRKIKLHNVILKILTNGMSISEMFIGELQDAGLGRDDIIQISLDAASDAAYFNQRGVQGFSVVCQNIQRLQEAGFSIEIHFTPTVYNITEVSDVYRLAQTLHCDYFSTAMLAPIGNATRKQMVSIEQLLKEEIQLIEMSEEAANTKYLGSLVSTNCAYMHLCEKKRTLVDDTIVQKSYYCAAGNSTVYIDEQGCIYPCVYMQFEQAKMGSLSQQSFEKIWAKHRELPAQFSLAGTPCGNCADFGKCTGGCLGVSSYYAGKLSAGYDIRCRRIENLLFESD